jgi:RNA ligase (TIGR02306 family)
VTIEMPKSTHVVEVIELKLRHHPNADLLSIADVWGYTAVTQTAQWDGQTTAAYLPPDSVVDCRRDEFSFLAKEAKADFTARIKAKKIRGVLSFGLLVPSPPGSKIGDNVADLLGVTHYDPDVRQAKGKSGLKFGGETTKAPLVYNVKYDLEAGRRYAKSVMQNGDRIIVTEKIHGCNARYVFNDGVMYCGSRTEWKKEYADYSHLNVADLVAQSDGGLTAEKATEIIDRLKSGQRRQNLWWQVLEKTSALRRYCESNPGDVVYGEVYGAVQDLNYGHNFGDVSFAAFDILLQTDSCDHWTQPTEFFTRMWNAEVPTAPIIAGADKAACSVEGVVYDFDTVCEMAEGKTLVPGASHCREGCVISPLHNRYDDRLGRIKLKFISADYLSRSKDSSSTLSNSP